jgi:hypothetical protein
MVSLKSWMVGLAGLSVLSLAACTMGGVATAIPAGRPANFDVQTITPTAGSGQQVQPTVVEQEAAFVLPLDNAPTHTPDPNATPTATVRPQLPAATVTLTTPVALTGVITLPIESPLATPTAPATAEPSSGGAVAEPGTADVSRSLEGGDWDFEAEFIPWGNPYGEPCPGAAVAAGWTAFVEDGEFGSSCFNENLYGPNVFSGLKSQELTFDFIAANSGVLRTIDTVPGHRYTILAQAKHDHSTTPVQMFLGIDFSGEVDWQAETVVWFPWDDPAEDSWTATEETVSATADRMTIFIRGYHPLAEQGGKTVIDNVSVTDLGTE